MLLDASLTAHWSAWRAHPSHDFTLGVEEEVMLLNPHDWSLAQQIDRVMMSVPARLSTQPTCDTHRATLALSANSPFWQGRDTGLASTRTALWQTFPRVGIPRAFGSYDEYVSSVDPLIRSGALTEPTFLWWDVRPQPRYGTVEVRVMDAQTSVERTVPLVALVQCLAKLECDEGYASSALLDAPEVLVENRLL